MAEEKRVLIVGGVAGGASTAARLRRLCENARIILFERGDHISFANCGLPYHIGNVIKEKDRLLVQTPEQMKKRFRIDVRVRSQVLRVDRENRSLIIRDLANDREYAEPYDVLVLSPGAEPVRPPIPGAEIRRVFTLRSMADMDAIKKLVDEEKPARAVIVGGGYIGLEMTEALVRAGSAGVAGRARAAGDGNGGPGDGLPTAPGVALCTESNCCWVRASPGFRNAARAHWKSN